MNNAVINGNLHALS